MAEKAVILIGDKTSHGGAVLEGLTDVKINGKLAAGIGHKVVCPQCKRETTIVAGSSLATWFGKAVAVDGMKTSCGATLIASQNLVLIDDGGGSSGGSGAATGGSSAAGAAVAASAAIAAASTSSKAAQDSTFNQHFLVQDQDGNAVSDLPIHFNGAAAFTDSSGKTQVQTGASGDQVELALFAENE